MSKGRKASRAPRPPTRRRNRDGAAVHIQPAKFRTMSPRAIGGLVARLQARQLKLEAENERLHGVQEELRRSFGRYRDLYDFAPVGYLTLAPDATIREANVTVARKLGTARGRLVGLNFTHFIAPESRSAFRQHQRSVLACTGEARMGRTRAHRRGVGHGSRDRAAGASARPARARRTSTRLTCELVLRAANGSTFPALVESVHDEDDRMHTSVCRCVISDMSERKKADSHLRANEAQYRLLFEANPNPMYVFAEDTLRLLAVNDAMIRQYGWSRGEMLDLKATDLRPPEEVPRFLAAVKRQRRANATFAGEWKHRRKDGTSFDVAVSVSGIDYAGQAARLVCVTEITARKEAEAALRKSEQKYRSLYENNLNGVFLVDGRGRFLEANPAALVMSGYSEAELGRRTFMDLCAPECLQETVGAFRDGMNGKLYDLTTAMHRKDGRRVELVLSGAPVLVGDGTVGLFCVARDISARKRAEAALGESQAQLENANRELEQQRARLQAVIDNLTEGLVMVDVKGQAIHWNPAAVEMHGFRSESDWRRRLSELHGIFKLSDAEGAVMPMDQWPLSRILRGEVLRGFEAQVRRCRKPGWERVFSYSGSLAHDAEGRLALAVMTITDITARKQAENALAHLNLTLEQKVADQTRALRESEAEFRSYFERLGVGAAEINEQGHFIRVNERFCSITGYSREELLNGMGPLDLDHPDDRKADSRGINGLFRGESYMLEKRYLAKDGRVIWVRITASPIFSAEGEFLHSAGVIEDITERKEAQSALAESEQYLRAILDTAAEGIVILDERGRIESVNPAATRLFGYAPEEMVNQNVSRFVVIEGKQKSADFLTHDMPQARRPLFGHLREVSGQTKSGEAINLELNLAPLTHGGRRGFVVLVHDITEQRRLEQELVEVGERERQTVGRELHDELGQILHGVHFLASDLEARLQQQGVAEAAELNRLSRFLDEALEAARRLAHGLHPVHPVPEGLMEALREQTARVRKIYGVSCRFACRQPVLVQDPTIATHLFRIAQEAITNAVKHSRCKRIFVRLKATPQCLTLGVRDDGRARKPPAQHRQGMGLHVMRFRASAINGSLTVQRHAKGGTEVICTVEPMARRPLNVANSIAQETSP